MSRPQEVLLKRLCREPETLTKARVILHAAQLKTGPGTGYDLRGASTALPAICAYIASEEYVDIVRCCYINWTNLLIRLHIGDVTQKMAQNASCVTPKDFNVCLSVVRAALATADPRPQTRNRSSTYEGLVVRFKYTRGDFMVSCMRDAEKALIEGGQLRGRLRPPNEIITIAIFCWVCELLKVCSLCLLHMHRVIVGLLFAAQKGATYCVD